MLTLRKYMSKAKKLTMKAGRRLVSNAMKSREEKTEPVVAAADEQELECQRLEQEQEQKNARELAAAEKRYGGKERDQVWAFISGHASEDFRGNPKYLFVYINKYRPDISAYWLCSSEETIEQVRSLGFTAHKIETPAAQYAVNHTGVLVVEQVKFKLQEGFEDVKYLNLWHGVGFKRIERKQFMGDIAMDLAKKYVKNGTFYRDHQMLSVSSPLMEKEQGEDLGLDSDKLIRAGYLRCLYQQNFDPVVSFEHDLRKVKGLPESTRMIVYAPTFRAKLGGTFAKAITDMDALHECCERNNVLLIFKVHPNMEKEIGFLRAWETYGDRKYFWFWDNRDDFYEIMDQMDMAIIDYSGIVSDMVAVGIKHYIRYIFDYDDYMQDGFTQGDYFDRTLGTVCYTFDELLKAIDTYDTVDESEDFRKINDKLWSYSEGKNDFEKVIQAVMDFEVEERQFPNLYSFDVFDTLFSRKVLDPVGIFYYVKEKMQETGGFPRALTENYPSIRHTAESNVREYYSKTQDLRNSDHVEISFEEIFDRLASVYNLPEEQKDLLKKWELEAELDNVVPLYDQIDLLKGYVANGDKVILISDMYLPKDFIEEMLRKADPILAELPLFLSNEYGVLKTSQKLYFEVYKSFEPFYDFKKWIHYGDNPNADHAQARRFGICVRRVERPVFDDIQMEMVEKAGTYDAYLVAAMQARMKREALYEKDEFVISYVALCMVPYVDWALRDAVRRGYQTLYFISRDGHPLKRIADEIIAQRHLNIKTKYIYASRRTWRIPSYIHEVDDGFWQGYGNFTDLASKEKLFGAMNLDEEMFRKLFPSINPDTINFLDKAEIKSLVEIFKDSADYHQYLLDRGAEERTLVSGYLKQEIDPSEKFAIVEYWGRGYTQDCMVRLWQDIVGEEVDVPFYYSRSVLPTMGSAVRYNFITNDTKQYFMEGIFANMPYKSIERYEVKDGKIVPVIVPIPYNEELFNSMQKWLPEFAKRYAALELRYPEDTDRMLYEFALNYFKDNLTNEDFAENIGTLIDSVALYGNKRQFAPPYTMEKLDMLEAQEITRGSGILTSNVAMSVTRSSEEVQKRYSEMYQILPGDNPAGGRLLTEEEQSNNRLFKEKYEMLKKRAAQFRELYEQAVSECDVEDKVLFADNKKSIANKGLDLVVREIEKHEGIAVSVVLLGKEGRSDEQIAREAATAKFIVVCNAVDLFCMTKFRPETKEIMLRSVAFPLYNQGLAAGYFLQWRKKYSMLAGRNDVSVLQIPSPERELLFRKNYCLSSKAECTLLGNCLTDLYYQEEFAKSARAKLSTLFPEAEGKKIILYMPTWRMRAECEEWLSLLEMDVLQKLIGEEYCVVLNFNTDQKKTVCRNRLEIPGFCKEISKGISVRELMVACDVIVGDYRDTFFEAALLHKPVYSTAYDYEMFIKSSNMSMNANSFEQFLFCPVVKSSDELSEELKKVDDYDYRTMEKFKNTMFAGCDGNSVNRVVEFILDNMSQTE